VIGRKAVILLAAVGILAAIPASSQAACASSTNCGTTLDGGQWIADFPSPISSWNGTLLLYSHGFGPPAAADAPDPTTRTALLDRGYALAGSSYDPTGSWWALDSALSDQFQTLQAVEGQLPAGKLQHVIAVGTSMGGLISSLEAEHPQYGLQAALTTCGIVAGGVNLNNYQLDGEYAMSQLLAPGKNIKLVRFSGPGDGLATGKELDVVAQHAKTTAAGRARLALAMSLMNVSTWAPGKKMPAPTDYVSQERQQYQVEFGHTGPLMQGAIQTTMDFVEFGRPWIDMASGGSATWTKGVNFGLLLAESPYLPEVISLYHQAGLNLWTDLQNLTQHANITADPGAVQSLEQTSVPTGQLQVPELDMHTISDQLVPVQQENYYWHTVTFAGRGDLLRQAFVQRQLHCNFNPAELVAGVEAIQQRVQTGQWGDLADPAVLNAAATATGLGFTPAFIPYFPAPLSGVNTPF
jgi:hypothetical protein